MKKIAFFVVNPGVPYPLSAAPQAVVGAGVSCLVPQILNFKADLTHWAVVGAVVGVVIGLAAFIYTKVVGDGE